LLLAEEDWIAKNKHRLKSNPSKEGSTGGGSGGQVKGKSPAKRDGGGGSGGQGVVKLTFEGTPRRKGRCHNCGIYGHWVEDCKQPKKEKKAEKKEEANVAVVDAQPALFLATASDVVHTSSEPVHLAEENVVPIHCHNGMWVLDTGASNHMTGTREALTRLNENVSGTVRFGDGSCVEIKGSAQSSWKGEIISTRY
jgi:hypothetical protein